MRDNCLYDQYRERPNFQKTWEDKRISKMEQRKKGSKSTFFRNNTQRQPNAEEPRMNETMRQRPR
jgi:hypothetical protein